MERDEELQEIQPNVVKEFGEVNTPYVLRQDMLDRLPVDFWKQPRRVLEPCCGKGGFVLDIVERFLEQGIPLPTVLQECLYWGDLNPTNVEYTT